MEWDDEGRGRREDTTVNMETLKPVTPFSPSPTLDMPFIAFAMVAWSASSENRRQHTHKMSSHHHSEYPSCEEDVTCSLREMACTNNRLLLGQ